MCIAKKSTNWVISHLLQKHLEKAKKYKGIDEISSLCFWDSRLLENTIFWLGDDTNSNMISYISLWIKTWSFQIETSPVWDILSVHAFPCFSTNLQKVRSKKTYKKKLKILEKGKYVTAVQIFEAFLGTSGDLTMNDDE